MMRLGLPLTCCCVLQPTAEISCSVLICLQYQPCVIYFIGCPVFVPRLLEGMHQTPDESTMSVLM